MKRCVLALLVALASLQALAAGSAMAFNPLPPTLSMSFVAGTVPVGAHVTVHFALGNPNAGYKLTNVAFADILPSGLVISTPSNLGGSCAGAPGAVATAVAGSRNIELSAVMFDGINFGGTNSCDLLVDVTGVAPGLQSTTTTAPTGGLSGYGTQTGLPATASIVVVAAPSIAAAFSPTSIAAGGTSYVTFTIANPAGNTVPLTGVGFTVTLPAGLSAAGPAGPMCGGTLTLSPPSGVSLSGATIAVGGQCQFSLMFAGVAAGSYTITTSHVASANGGSGNVATAPLTANAAATPTPTPSGTPAASDSASGSPGDTAAPSASTAAASPSPAQGGQQTAGDSGPNALILVALGVIVGLGLGGLLVALYFWRKRRAA